MTTTIAILIALLLLPVLVLLWATESKPQRARRMRGYGLTQQAIATRLGCSRTTSLPSGMKWINRAAVITLLLAVYAAGYDTGRFVTHPDRCHHESR